MGEGAQGVERKVVSFDCNRQELVAKKRACFAVENIDWWIFLAIDLFTNSLDFFNKFSRFFYDLLDFSEFFSIFFWIFPDLCLIFFWIFFFQFKKKKSDLKIFFRFLTEFLFEFISQSEFLKNYSLHFIGNYGTFWACESRQTKTMNIRKKLDKSTNKASLNMSTLTWLTKYAN